MPTTKKLARFSRVPVKKVVVSGAPEPEEEPPTLQNIYHDPKEEEKKDMTRLDRKKRNPGRIFAVAVFVILLLAAVAWAGFFFFHQTADKTGSSLRLEFSAPTTAASGEEIELELLYTNVDTVSLGEIEMTMQYPDGFQFESADPEAQNEYGTVWELPKLLPGASTRIKMKGQIIGEVNSSKTFDANLTYEPTNFSSPFTDKVSHSLLIDSSIISLSIDAPVRIVSEQDFTYSVEVENTSDQSLKNVRLFTVVPDDFTFASTDPARSNDEKHFWELDRLDPSEKKTYKVTGSLSANSGETREMTFRAGLVDSTGTFTAQSEVRSLIFVVKPELNLQLTLEGSSSDQSIILGQQLDYELSYENASDLKLLNIALVTSFESEKSLLDFETIVDQREGTFRGTSITWDKESVSDFAELKPGDKGTIVFSVKVKSTVAPKTQVETNLKLTSQASVASLTLEDVGEGEFEIKSKSNAIISKLTTQADIQTEARYYNDELEIVGDGPLPPQVGKTTTYRLYWYVSNTTNDIEDVVVQARLPENTLYIGRGTVTAGSGLKFDPETRIVSWRVTNIPSLSGTLFSNVIASFDVSVTPSEADLGSLMLLSEETTLTATDKYTEASLSDEAVRLTSDLQNDPGGIGKGKVVEATGEEE